ncbi:hypothetical protein [Streptomyces sp. Ac-502]|uniref:hypothetical protein n=1 Tax=Streptomyces sp. Ac-502 TaxID=3342801 RepID=UPI003862645B
MSTLRCKRIVCTTPTRTPDSLNSGVTADVSDGAAAQPRAHGRRRHGKGGPGRRRHRPSAAERPRPAWASFIFPEERSEAILPTAPALMRTTATITRSAQHRRRPCPET